MIEIPFATPATHVSLTGDTSSFASGSKEPEVTDAPPLRAARTSSLSLDTPSISLSTSDPRWRILPSSGEPNEEAPFGG